MIAIIGQAEMTEQRETEKRGRKQLQREKEKETLFFRYFQIKSLFRILILDIKFPRQSKIILRASEIPPEAVLRASRDLLTIR